MVLNAKKDYPFAASCINVVNLIFSMLEFSQKTEDIDRLYHSSEEFDTKLMNFFCKIPEKEAFEEVFAILVIALDRLFGQMKATYMQFPNVLSRLKKVMEELLETNPLSLEQLRFQCFQRLMTEDLVSSADSIKNAKKNDNNK